METISEVLEVWGHLQLELKARPGCPLNPSPCLFPWSPSGMWVVCSTWSSSPRLWCFESSTALTLDAGPMPSTPRSPVNTALTGWVRFCLILAWLLHINPALWSSNSGRAWVYSHIKILLALKDALSWSHLQIKSNCRKGWSGDPASFFLQLLVCARNNTRNMYLYYLILRTSQKGRYHCMLLHIRKIRLKNVK